MSVIFSTSEGGLSLAVRELRRALGPGLAIDTLGTDAGVIADPPVPVAALAQRCRDEPLVSMNGKLVFDVDLTGLLAASYLQVLASIYLGWFLLAGLGISTGETGASRLRQRQGRSVRQVRTVQRVPRVRPVQQERRAPRVPPVLRVPLVPREPLERLGRLVQREPLEQLEPPAPRALTVLMGPRSRPTRSPWIILMATPRGPFPRLRAARDGAAPARRQGRPLWRSRWRMVG